MTITECGGTLISHKRGEICLDEIYTPNFERGELLTINADGGVPHIPEFVWMWRTQKCENFPRWDKTLGLVNWVDEKKLQTGSQFLKWRVKKPGGEDGRIGRSHGGFLILLNLSFRMTTNTCRVCCVLNFIFCFKVFGSMEQIIIIVIIIYFVVS